MQKFEQRQTGHRLDPAGSEHQGDFGQFSYNGWEDWFIHYHLLPMRRLSRDEERTPEEATPAMASSRVS